LIINHNSKVPGLDGVMDDEPSLQRRDAPEQKGAETRMSPTAAPVQVLITHHA